MKKNMLFSRGEARVELCGGERERLLNACADAALPLWDIEAENDLLLRLSLFERDLPRFEELARLCRCEIAALTVRGGSVGAARLRARARLGVLAALCALLLVFSGLFIWDFEVVGNEKLSKGEILRALADCGVREGSFWPGLDPERVRSAMLLRCDELAWMTVNVRGSRATVLVLERRKKPEIYAESAATDLVASRDGVVRALTVKNGRAFVAPGELVTAGQTLVSGEMPGPAGAARRVRAEGKIEAETWPVRRVFIACGARGKEVEKGFRLILGLKLGNSRLNLVANSRKELDECDKIVKEYTLGLAGVFRFPITLIAEVYRPYRPTEELAPASAAAQARALAALAEEIDGEILSYGFEQTPTQLVLRAHCLENIATTKETQDP